MIYIYSQNGCGPCQQVKSLFEKSALVEREDYVILDINENPVAKQFVLDLGFKSVPVVTNHDASKVIHLYNPYALAEIINSVILDKETRGWDGETEDGRYLH